LVSALLDENLVFDLVGPLRTTDTFVERTSTDTLPGPCSYRMNVSR
jgi:hypothetical protein